MSSNPSSALSRAKAQAMPAGLRKTYQVKATDVPVPQGAAAMIRFWTSDNTHGMRATPGMAPAIFTHSAAVCVGFVALGRGGAFLAHLDERSVPTAFRLAEFAASELQVVTSVFIFSGSLQASKMIAGNDSTSRIYRELTRGFRRFCFKVEPLYGVSDLACYCGPRAPSPPWSRWSITTKLENVGAAGDYQEGYAYWNAMASPPSLWLGDKTELDEYVS